MFERFNKAPVSLVPNLWNFPYNYMYIEDMEEFNDIYQHISKWRKLKRTPSGGISDKHFYYPSYDLDLGNSSIELVICSTEGFFRLVIFMRKRHSIENVEKKEELNGNKAFKEFKKICKQFGFNLDRYKIKNGYEIKKQIEKPLIKLEHKFYEGLTIENAHHLDINSAWPAALARINPQFVPIMEYIFKKKQELKDMGISGDKNIYKAILNYSIGYMQSLKAFHRAAWAHFSKNAINENNRYMRELAEDLRRSGRNILAYNTDGIWYTGEVYHGSGEGKGLGEWENDHTNCIIRFKSAGSYEYIENGVYKPVVRGNTQLDIKGVDRANWKWGDIFTKECEEIVYSFVENKGLIRGENYEL